MCTVWTASVFVVYYSFFLLCREEPFCSSSGCCGWSSPHLLLDNICMCKRRISSCEIFECWVTAGNGPVFLVTGLDRLTPGHHLAVFFSTRLRNLAFFFVPGVNRASPISTRAKTVDLPGCGVSTRSADCLSHVIPPKSGAPSDV